MDEVDKSILIEAQDGFPLTSRPFLEIGKRTGVAEEEVIRRIKKMISEGIVRRFSATIAHRKLGIKANPLVAWKVPKERVEETGKKMASFREVTHCYERRTVPGKWDYNVFTVVHDYSDENAENTIRRISDAVKIRDYITLYSTREYKKTYRRLK